MRDMPQLVCHMTQFFIDVTGVNVDTGQVKDYRGTIAAHPFCWHSLQDALNNACPVVMCFLLPLGG